MPAFTLCLIGLVAYLLGSIPFGYLLVRIFRSQDIRTTGSGNIGATNVVRSGAKGLGAATFVLDALKGFLAVAVARELLVASLPAWPSITQMTWRTQPVETLDVAAAVAAMAAVLGHVYPVWLRFKGGKGVATAFGVLLQLVPLGALAGLGVFIVTVLVSRYVSLASILGAMTIPIVGLLLAGPLAGVSLIHRPWLLAAVIAIPVLVIAKHHANLRRLLNGSEYRFGSITGKARAA